jgi:uncharacterized membrane protein YeaQ/YmgE (transglycosylase-associated protein family)
VSAGIVVAILISGLFTGALARLAVPGPDPMPLWLTVAIGLAGSIVGAVVARALFNDNGYVVSFGSLFVAMGLVVAYRRFVQHRPVWGPGAMRFPERGLGVEQYRERLRRLGVDPDRLGPRGTASPTPPPPDPAPDLLAMLEELHEAGLLDDEELAAKRALVERREHGPAT